MAAAGFNLKDPKEVEEYLKNLHIEYQFGCLSEKKPEVCHLLGDYMEAIKTDYAEAAKQYKNNCDLYKFGRSCTKYGGYRLSGKGCKQDSLDAYNYMKKGCDLDDTKGCFYAGSFALTDEKLEENKTTQITRGMEMLRKSCNENEEKACFRLSCAYLRGIEGFIEKDFKEAYVLALKACEHGNPYACANVSLMHKKGDGVQQNLELAQTFRTRAEDLLEQLKKAQTQIKFHEGLNP